MQQPKSGSKSVLLWSADGTATMSALGSVDTAFARHFFKPGSLPGAGTSVPGTLWVPEAAAASDSALWFNINTEGWDWLEIFGEFNMVDNTGLTSVASMSLRHVALRLPRFTDDADFHPWQTQDKPLANYLTNLEDTLDTTIMGAAALGGFPSSDANNATFGFSTRTSYASVSFDCETGVINHDDISNGGRTSWSFAPTERSVYEAVITGNLIRSSLRGVKRTGQVFVSLAWAPGALVGSFDDVILRGNVWAVLSK